MKTENRYPPLKPYVPCEPKREYYNTEGCLEHKTIYRCVEPIGDCEIDLEEYFADMDQALPQPKLSYNQMTLQDVMDLAPPGAKLSDIRLDVSYPRMAEYLDVAFVYYKRDLEAEESAFQTAYEKYEKEMIVYQKQLKKYEDDLADYNEWTRQQKVKELELELANLKK